MTKTDEIILKLEYLINNNYEITIDSNTISALLRYIKRLENLYVHTMQNLSEIELIRTEAIKHCKQEINASSIQYERNHKQQELVYKVAHERILNILQRK